MVPEPCWDWVGGFGMEGPLGMGFLDEEDGGALRCHDYMYEIWDGSMKSLWEALSW